MYLIIQCFVYSKGFKKLGYKVSFSNVYFSENQLHVRTKECFDDSTALAL